MSWKLYMFIYYVEVAVVCGDLKLSCHSTVNHSVCEKMWAFENTSSISTPKTTTFPFSILYKNSKLLVTVAVTIVSSGLCTLVVKEPYFCEFSTKFVFVYSHRVVRWNPNVRMWRDYAEFLILVWPKKVQISTEKTCNIEQFFFTVNMNKYMWAEA